MSKAHSLNMVTNSHFWPKATNSALISKVAFGLDSVIRVICSGEWLGTDSRRSERNLNVPTMNDWFAQVRTVKNNASMSESRTLQSLTKSYMITG